MIFFGHLGPTTAVVKIIDNITKNKKENGNINKIDYRMVLIGSDLPDIIDKPIGAVLFRNTFHNSRIFCHTLLFVVILLAIGIALGLKNKNFKNNLLVLWFCGSIHLILDSMWLFKGILFWPFLGWKFPTRADGNWASDDLQRLLTDPTYYGPELLGFLILVYFALKLIRQGKFKRFIYTGEM